MVCLLLLVPVAFVALVGLSCMGMETVYETDIVMNDTTGHVEIPARGYVQFEGTVTPEMLKVEGMEKAFLVVDADIQDPTNRDVCVYIMDDDNYFSYQVGGPFVPVCADTSISWPSTGIWVTTPGRYHWVADNRRDSVVKRSKILFMIGHYARPEVMSAPAIAGRQTVARGPRGTLGLLTNPALVILSAAKNLS